MAFDLCFSFKGIWRFFGDRLCGIFRCRPDGNSAAVVKAAETESLNSEYLYDITIVPRPYISYSESDDSDEETLSNHSGECHERISEIEKHSSPATADTKESTILETWENDTLNGTMKSWSISDKSAKKVKRKKPIKTSVVRIHISFDSLSSQLILQVLQIYNLAKEKKFARKSISDIFTYQLYCVVLPEKKYKFITKLRSGPDAIFNETFVIHNLATYEASKLVLKFRLYASVRPSIFNMIGKCILALNSIDLTVESDFNITMNEPDENENTYEDELSTVGPDKLRTKYHKKDCIEGIPELQFGLCHNSIAGRLIVEIIRGINLPKLRYKDFFVKVSLHSSTGTKLSRAKTTVRKNSTSPIFRESFIFPMAEFKLGEVTLLLSVFAKKLIHRNRRVGWITLGYRPSGDEELCHWNEIRQRHSNQIVRNHKLHQNNNAKQILE